MTPPFKVVVTGFGPFRDHKVNASWVAVQLMEKTGGLGEDVDLEIREIPVEYASVDHDIPKIWKTHKPKLMVHVGVSGKARAITLEECARNHAYEMADIKGRCPKKNCCKKSGQDQIPSSLNMQKVAEEARMVEPGVQIETSQDAGRYLCEYIYYTSLNLNQGYCAFIHVPPLNRVYTDQQLADGLRAIIRKMIEQIREKS